MKIIDVYTVIESNIAVSPTKGELLYNAIKNCIEKGEKIQLDFKSVDQLTTAFLNNAIGNLYKNYTSDDLNKYLKVAGLDDLDKYLLTKVINRAKLNIEDDDELNYELKGGN